MADKKITELEELTSLAFEDYIPVVDYAGGSPVTKKISFENLQKSLKFGDGGVTNYADFGTDGTMALHGNATAFDDLVFELHSSRKGATEKPDFDYTNLGYLFPQNDTTEYIDFIIQMPHKWKQGSTIFPHIHCVQSANQQAVFKLDYKWYNLGSTVPAPSTYTMDTYLIGYTSGSIGQLIHGGTGISGAGKTFSSILKARLYRNDNAYTGDILVDQFDIHYEIDSFGTSSEYSK